MDRTVPDEPFLYGGRTLEQWLPLIVDRVAGRFEPERIVLFGSLAAGRAGRDSDIDLLVIMREAPDPRSTAVDLRLAIADIPAPVDFIVVDAARIARYASVPGTAIASALEHGMTVYAHAI